MSDISPLLNDETVNMLYVGKGLHNCNVHVQALCVLSMQGLIILYEGYEAIITGNI